MKTIRFSLFAILMSLIFISCDLINPLLSDDGYLSINGKFNDEIIAKASSANSTSDISRIRCTITKNGNTEKNFDLDKNGSRFSGSVKLKKGSYNVQLNAYTSSNILIYSGSESGVDVSPMKTTNCTINLYAESFYLNIYTSPSGSGTVSKSPNRSSYSYNESVQLTASPNSNYQFDHWGGDLSGSSNPYTINMSGNKSVTAYFEETPDQITYSVTPSSWDYGTFDTGQTSSKSFTITNSSSSTASLSVSSQSITGTNSSDFSIISGSGSFTLSPGSSHTTTIRFTANSAGSKSATFRISSNSTSEPTKDVNLSASVNQPADQIYISVSPSSWDYGTFDTGQTSSKSFTITNSSSSTASLSVSSQSFTGTNASDFSITSGSGSFTLSPGSSHTTTIRFTANSAGSKSATFRISSNSTSEPTKDVSLSATVNQSSDEINILVGPSSWDFGTLDIGQTSSKSFTITNSSSSTANMSVTNQSFTGTNSSDFSITSGSGSFTLSPGSSHTTTIRFTANSAGSKSATFRISSNSTSEPTKDVSLSASVNQPADQIYISVSPSSWDYGTFDTGQTSSKSFTITNSSSSTASLSVSSQSFTGTNASDFSITSGSGSFTLSPGSSHTTTIRFTANSAGSKSATFRISSNSTSEPTKDVSLSASVNQPADQIYISVSPSSWDYGTFDTGQTSSKSFTITNSSSSTASLSVSSQSITGTNASDFSITSGSGSFTLSPGSSHTTTIRFTANSAGSKSATFRISSNSTSEPTKDVNLSASVNSLPDTLNVTADTYIDAANPDSNYGNNVRLIVSQGNYQSRKQILLKWVNIPNSLTQITKAEIWLKLEGWNGGPIPDVHVPGDFWEENTATYTDDGDDYSGHDIIASTSNTPPDSWYVFSGQGLTDLVKGWADQSEYNMGVIITIDQTGSLYIRFDSRETESIPYLKLYY